MRFRCFTVSSSCKWKLFKPVGLGSHFRRLLFMTYNGFIMLAVAVGAFTGYLAFGTGPSAKTVACH